MPFEMLFGLIAVVAGAVATISGFGIGSFLTPTLAIATNTKLAVAAVAIPHLIGSSVRFWKLRQHIDTSLLYSFGLMSAVGGLFGALLHTVLQSVLLKIVFGLLLMFAGLMGVTGFINRMRFYGHGALGAGFLSGTLGVTSRYTRGYSSSSPLGIRAFQRDVRRDGNGRRARRRWNTSSDLLGQPME